MNGGTIIGNTPMNGGGVYVVSGGTFTMNGGTITGNAATESGGGVYIVSGGTFTMNGGVITGNTGNNAENNVFISAPITIGGPLAAGTRVGVTMTDPGSFTTGYTEKGNAAHPSTYFTSDDPNLFVVLTDGEAKLADVPKITGADLALNGSLDFRFYVDIPAGIDTTGANMTFSIGGRSARRTEVAFDKATKINGKYVFSFPVYSIEMAEPVTATFRYGTDGTVEKVYSVKDYLDLADTQYQSDTKLHALTNAARDYGHYMQLYLAELHGFTVGTDDETHTYDYQTMANASEITALTALDGYKTVWNSTPTSVLKAVGYYDTFNETTTLNILFRVADGTGTITATADEVACTVESVDEQGVAFGSNTYRIRIPDIAANNLDHAYRVQLSADGNTFCDMNVSALTYVSTMLANGSPTENEAKALTALYNYNVEADGYNQ